MNSIIFIVGWLGTAWLGGKQLAKWWSHDPAIPEIVKYSWVHKCDACGEKKGVEYGPNAENHYQYGWICENCLIDQDIS